MPTPPPSITLEPAPHPALNYAGLRAEALELLGGLCGDQWSDFNSHDPGITILEQLCFALTELAYRGQWPITDLLASAGPDWQPTAEAILSGDPVTRDDVLAHVRALGYAAVVVEEQEPPELALYFRPSNVVRGPTGGPVGQGAPPVAGDLELETDLDSRPGARPPTAVAPRGVWRVAAQLGDGRPDQGPASLEPIARHLHAARLLGRDFSVAPLTPFAVVVRAELELVAPEVDPSLMRRLRDSLNAALTRAGAQGVDGILHGSTLVQAFLAFPEVSRVISLRLASGTDGPSHPWHLPLPGHTACLHPDSTIQLSHRGLPLAVPSPPVAVQPGSTDAMRASLPPPAPAPRPGRRRAFTTHRSLARQLPAVYGVGPAGLPADATPERRALALQLRAYLWLFDQLLANGQAQLAIATRLLAPVDPRDPHPLDAEGVLPALDPDLPLTDLELLLDNPPAALAAKLRQALRDSAPAAAAGQRAALLAHLLRRFGEELELLSEPSTYLPLVTARSDFLRRIVPLTGGRGSGPNLLAPEPHRAREANQGPFAERLRRKLGLPLAVDGTPPLLVIEHLLLRPVAEDSSQRVQGGEDPIPFLSDVARPDPWSGRVSVVINAALLPAMPDHNRDHWLTRLLRQELPAHLRAELHLLADPRATPGQGPWSTLLAAWCRFRDLLQAQRLAAAGAVTPADPLLLSLRLRDSRDQLLTLLRIGLPWPLRAIPLPKLLLVPSGTAGTITLPYSQRGVRYQLVDAASGAAVGTAKDGTDAPITLATPSLTADITVRVQASVLTPRAPGSAPAASEVALTANGRARATLLAGEVRVVEGINQSLTLRLLGSDNRAVPKLHADGSALLADHGQRLQVEITTSQLGVVYEVIDNAQRELPFLRQTPLSGPVTGTAGAIRLALAHPATEDLDLSVRATLEKWRGDIFVQDQRMLAMVLPLRVRADPTVRPRLVSPDVEAGSPATVAIGAAAGSTAATSQTSVIYQLWARPLADDDWQYDNPALAPSLTTIDSTPRGLAPQAAQGQGNGEELRVELPIREEGMVVAALARKTHRLAPLTNSNPRTHPSEVFLRQGVVAYTRPDAERRLILLRDAAINADWSLWGGQPGVAYTLKPVTPSRPLAIPEREEAPGGRRGIGRQRLGRDLVVDANDGIPEGEFVPDLSRISGLQVWARFLRSGVEVALKQPPILAWVVPMVGGGARVVLARLVPNQTARLLRGDTVLREDNADEAGTLRLSTGPVAANTFLILEINHEDGGLPWRIPLRVT